MRYSTHHGKHVVCSQIFFALFILMVTTLYPGSSEVPRNPLTRWDVSSIPANGIFLTKKLN